MKKVLMVAFEFPPLSSGGVMRCTKYVKYLRDYGWEPIVLTVAENAHPDALQDPRLLDELPPDITIHRTPYADFDALFQKELQNSALLKIYQSLDAGFPGLFGFAKPDKNITWFPAALEKASRIVSQERVDLIYTDSPPNSTALIGYKIKESFGIPWISGFRDPWSLDDLVYEDLKDRYHSRAREADALLENIILENCDRLIVVSEKLKEKYVTRLGIPEPRISVIPNGYDAEDFYQVMPEKKPAKTCFDIKYMGSFYGSYNPSIFLTALDKLIIDHDIADIRFHVIGHGSTWVKQHLAALNLERLAPFIKTEAHMNLTQCLSRMLGSDLMLAVSPSQIDYNVPQKIYTYMKMGIPIFAVMPENGEAASIIKASGAGYVVDPTRVDRVEKKLYEIYRLWKADSLELTPDMEFIAGFDRRKLTGTLADLFNDICGQRIQLVDEMNRDAELLYGQGEFKEALDRLHSAALLDPASTETLNNLGVVYFQLQQYENALACFIKILEMKPENKDALINAYQLYRSLDLAQDAADILDKIRELFGHEESAGWIESR